MIDPPPKLDYEPHHDYLKFMVYLRQKKPRSLYRAYADFCYSVGIRIAKTVPAEWYRLQKQWNWDARAANYDLLCEQEDQRQAVALKNRKQQAWKQRTEESREHKWRQRQRLSQTIDKMLDTPIESLQWTIKDMLEMMRQVDRIDAELLPTALAEVKAISDLKNSGIIPPDKADQIDVVLNDAYSQVRELLSNPTNPDANL